MGVATNTVLLAAQRCNAEIFACLGYVSVLLLDQPSFVVPFSQSF